MVSKMQTSKNQIKYWTNFCEIQLKKAIKNNEDINKCTITCQSCNKNILSINGKTHFPQCYDKKLNSKHLKILEEKLKKTNVDTNYIPIHHLHHYQEGIWSEQKRTESIKNSLFHTINDKKENECKGNGFVTPFLPGGNINGFLQCSETENVEKNRDKIVAIVKENSNNTFSVFENNV